MWKPKIEVDERAIAVEHRAGAFAYKVTGYLLIIDMVLRVLRPGLIEWDFGVLDRPMPGDVLTILAVGGIAQWWVMIRERTVGPKRAVLLGVVLLTSMLLAAAIAAGLAHLR